VFLHGGALNAAKPAGIWVRTATNVATNPVVWGLSQTAGATYEGEEDTDSNFTSPTPVYSGPDRTNVTVSASGTYYYGVRAVTSRAPGSGA
jgi:hypothetical protein